MPVYEYKCQDHGVFFELSTIADREKPTICPTCGVLAARIIQIAPEFFKMNSDLKAANDLNERNQHEPTYSTAERRESDEEHSKGCGCERKIGKSNLMYTAQGEKMFPSMRPWMISH